MRQIGLARFHSALKCLEFYEFASNLLHDAIFDFARHHQQSEINIENLIACLFACESSQSLTGNFYSDTKVLFIIDSAMRDLRAFLPFLETILNSDGPSTSEAQPEEVAGTEENNVQLELDPYGNILDRSDPLALNR